MKTFKVRFYYFCGIRTYLDYLYNTIILRLVMNTIYVYQVFKVFRTVPWFLVFLETNVPIETTKNIKKKLIVLLHMGISKLWNLRTDTQTPEIII